MEIKPIRNEADYKKALERLEPDFDAKRGSEEGDKLEILAIFNRVMISTAPRPLPLLNMYLVDFLQNAGRPPTVHFFLGS